MRRPSLAVLGRVLLGASLALNLVLGGLLLMRDRSSPSPNPRRLLARVERLLPEADRAAFEREVAARREEMAAAERRIRQGLAPVRDAIGAQPFDPAALRAAMMQGRAPWNDFSNLFDDTLVRALSAISPEGRQRVAQDMPGPDRNRADPDTAERRDGDRDHDRERTGQDGRKTTH
ncbi:periplasmic heavy metal sensor [Roseomonas elaeocarpi]|uniref:Periplasmic heavy metal sensor n=1 Tax=Roseomonas elaeocarpi TaxID=907779 RepID=A0ABV6JYI0_9PROT